ncbi:MAG: DUF6516 family protein [Candidatus Bathyarchaeia archaeon]|jgi:hypothetical protein
MPNDSNLEALFNRIIDLIYAVFSDIVIDVHLRFSPSGSIERLRVFLIDDTFIDVWLSASGKYSYHWEQRHVRGIIHRHDNVPHSKWKKIKTFPKHFHDRTAVFLQPTKSLQESLDQKTFQKMELFGVASRSEG